MIKDMDFVRLNLDPLATTIQANARAWVKELGKFLNESAREDLNALKGEIEVCVSCSEGGRRYLWILYTWEVSVNVELGEG